MKKVCILLLIPIFWCCGKKDEKGKEFEKPNIIFILADDLGYGELGFTGQEIIETPNIDQLAEDGMFLSRFYTGAPVCAPARGIFLTGLHSGHAHIRGNDEWGDRGDVWDMEAMLNNPHLEGQRPLTDSVVLISQILKNQGYATGMVGKWGLGAPTTNSIPNKKGFDYFLGYNCQRQAHTYYPTHLWKNEERLMLDNKLVKMHANLEEGADPSNPDSYADFKLTDYAPNVMHKGALEFINDHAENPFFLYYASPIPHLPLQAEEKWISYYREKIGEEEPFTGKSYFPCQYPKATYAAMISTLDEQVGELVALLKEKGIYDNTLIIFTSDNGPTYTGGADTPFFNSARPFRTEYGFGKGFVREGGIRVPTIAHWPAHIKKGQKISYIGGFQDFFPTFCELSGAALPEQTDGISLVPLLTGNEGQNEHDYLYWEFPEYNGQQAIRMGKWKGIRADIKEGNLDIELYDLSVDSLEINNIAQDYPEIIKEIEIIFKKEHIEATMERFRMAALGDQISM